ncbi:MAG: hypothetical protein OEW08_15010 [Gammaproteobacteria bacterium]|nr:hypothetical protein [Gammaproteobacteria bacterium]
MNPLRVLFSTSLILFNLPALANRAEEIRAKITVDGANVVYQNAVHSSEFKKILSGIQSGDRVWLDVAAALRSVSDTHGSEQLDTAFSDALSKSAGTALVYLQKPFRARDVCKPRMVEPESGELNQFFTRIEHALNAAQDGTLQDKKSVCLYYLGVSKRMIDAIDVLARHNENPEKIAEEIKTTGVMRVNSRLISEGVWDSVISRIAAGNPETWIGLAMSFRSEPTLRPQIDLALATALMTNPFFVLTSAPNEAALSDICTVKNFKIATSVQRDIGETLDDVLAPMQTQTALATKVRVCLSALKW